MSQDLSQVTCVPASAGHPSYLSLKVTREELPTCFNQLDLPTSLCSHLYTNFTFCVYLFIVCSSSGLCLPKSIATAVLYATKWPSITQRLEQKSLFNKYALPAFHMQAFKLQMNQHSKQCIVLASGKGYGSKRNWEMERVGQMGGRATK